MTPAENRSAWAGRVAAERESASLWRALAQLRSVPRLDWTVGGDGFIWLRGDQLDDALRAQLVGAGVELFIAAADGQLVSAVDATRQVPSARLPECEWQPGVTLAQLVIDAPSLAGTVPASMPLALALGGAEHPPAALRLPLDVLTDWANLAPEWRLERLDFAADESGEALVVGSPLPPLPGVFYWSDERVYVPAGMRLDPEVDGRTARLVLGRLFVEAAEEDSFVIEVTGAARISAAAWQPIGRAALRVTLAEARGE